MMNKSKADEIESNLRKVFELLNQSCIDLPVEKHKILPDAKQFIWQSLIAIDYERIRNVNGYITDPALFNKFN